MIDKLSQGDFPANALEKPGYRLEFNDEFDGPVIDESKWLPYYLPQWSSRARSAPQYTFADGCLVLQITADQPPWCPEFDGQVCCSSIQSGVFAGPLGSPLGQHRFNPGLVVREEQKNARTYVPQYGYFEARARAVASPSNHVALWMIGYEDEPEHSGEINIFEIMGDQISAKTSQIGYGVRPWADPRLREDFRQDFLPIDAARFHVYALEWTPSHLDFYVDNVKIGTLPQSPGYPMQFFLGIYERPIHQDGKGASAGSTAYPKQFFVDYFRAYQPIGGYETR